MKNCEVCRFCEKRAEVHFEDCEKKTIFGMVPSGRWVEGEDQYCLAMPKPVNIRGRNGVPCSLFEIRENIPNNGFNLTPPVDGAS